MTSINWENDRRRRQGARAEIKLRGPKKKQLAVMPPDLASLFDLAESRHKTGAKYAAVLSIKRQFLLTGKTSPRQKSYLLNLGGGAWKEPEQSVNGRRIAVRQPSKLVAGVDVEGRSTAPSVGT